MIPEYDVLCSMFDFPVNKELIDHASKLRLIANYAVGYNNIDVAYALEKGLTVANTPDPVTAPTANIALGLMLDTARRITECDRKLRTLGKDMKVGVLENLGMPVTGQTLGIIGMGRIGRAVARRAKAFNMAVHYHNRSRLPEQIEGELEATYWEDLDEMLARMDFVSVNCPLTDETKHLLNSTRLKKMQQHAVIINTARGGIVDEEALADLIEVGRIAGAGLDVFEEEPSINPKLLELDNVVLLPHMGSATIEGRVGMGEKVLINIRTFMDNHRPPDRVLPF